jgi:hypothetical protein
MKGKVQCQSTFFFPCLPNTDPSFEKPNPDILYRATAGNQANPYEMTIVPYSLKLIYPMDSKPIS